MKLLSLLLAPALCLALMSAEAAPPPAELFYRDAAIAEAALSPSGTQLAITTSKGGTRIGLGVIDLAPGGKATQIVQFSDADVTGVQWVNDGRLLFGAIDLANGLGKVDAAPGLFAVNPDGKRILQLVRRRGTPWLTDGSSREERLDWQHRLLRVPAAALEQAGKPSTVNEEVLLAHFTVDERRLLTPIWINTRTGLTRTVDVKAPANSVHWLTDSRGELRVAVTRQEGRQAAWWRAPGASSWKQLYESALISTPFDVQYVDDAGKLFVTRNDGPAGQAALSRYDFERQAPEAKPLVMTPGFDFAGELVTDVSSGQALGVRLTTDAETTVWFDPTLKALQAQADRLLPGKVNRIDCRRCGSPDMVALVRSYSDQEPGQLWLYQAQPAAGSKAWRPIGRVRDGVQPEQMANLELHRIAARDGRDLPVWVTRSPTAKGALPAVVLVHGGPWVRGSSWRWEADAQFLASRGYVVIEPEMRGSTGYGDAHFRAGFKQWGQAMQDDVADALRWAQAQGLASDKACIAGASYGGYSTLMGLIKDPTLYRCGVAWMAVTDLELFLTGSWLIDDDISATGRRYTLPELVGDTKTDAAMIAANSPVKLAERIKAPLLLAFGEADKRVPLAHGERLRKALRAAGNEPEWVTYADEGHGFGALKNRIDFAQRMEAFLAKHLLRP